MQLILQANKHIHFLCIFVCVWWTLRQGSPDIHQPAGVSIMAADVQVPMQHQDISNQHAEFIEL